MFVKAETSIVGARAYLPEDFDAFLAGYGRRQDTPAAGTVSTSLWNVVAALGGAKWQSRGCQW